MKRRAHTPYFPILAIYWLKELKTMPHISWEKKLYAYIIVPNNIPEYYITFPVISITIFLM